MAEADTATLTADDGCPSCGEELRQVGVEGVTVGLLCRACDIVFETNGGEQHD